MFCADATKSKTYVIAPLDNSHMPLIRSQCTGLQNYGSHVTWSMRHLTSEGLKGRGMASTRRPRSWVQYSNTRKMLQDKTSVCGKL